MKKRKQQSNHGLRSAFTLVEMLVSVTLILLIMSLFAGIFGLASDTVKRQRGIAENDQRARALLTLLRNDFDKRTYRNVVPYYPTENDEDSPTDFASRAGYIYLSCNDPESGHDDLIQFTVDAGILTASPDTTRYFGAAALLAGTTTVDAPNQPEADDRDIRNNGAGASNAAEIAIFMRNGKLYRRVSLLRDPVEELGELQPQLNDGTELFETGTGVGGSGQFVVAAGTTNDFWRYFDYSALPRASALIPTNVDFVGISQLNNGGGSGTTALGLPFNRFGFNWEAAGLLGQSREHDNVTSQRFMGRWTHAETSDGNFNYPIAPAVMSTTTGNPMSIIDSPTNLFPGNDVVDDFSGATGRGGVRRMEDLLLTNVESFEIEIWDERVGRYVVPGYGALTDTAGIGDYHIRRNLQYDGTDYSYGPLAAAPASIVPHVFDTWHPGDLSVPGLLDLDNDATETMEEIQPPYFAYRYYPPLQSAAVPGPTVASAPTEPSPTANPSAPLVSYWEAGTDYNVGDIVFASDAVGTVGPGWEVATPGFNWQDDDAAIPDQAFHVAYRCVVDNGSSDATTPPAKWPTTPGRRVADGTDLIWEAFDNRRPLTSIRMTVRFKDESSDQIRQLTMILPLTDD